MAFNFATGPRQSECSKIHSKFMHKVQSEVYAFTIGTREFFTFLINIKKEYKEHQHNKDLIIRFNKLIDRIHNAHSEVQINSIISHEVK